MLPSTTSAEASPDQRHISSKRNSISDMVRSSNKPAVRDVLDFTSFHLDIRGAEPTFTEVYVPGEVTESARRHRGDDVACRVQWIAASGVLAAYAIATCERATGRFADSEWWKDSPPIVNAQIGVLLSSAWPVMSPRSLTVQRFMRRCAWSTPLHHRLHVTLFTVTV